jgi:membrane protease YdiL (CAAX protease family)
MGSKSSTVRGRPPTSADGYFARSQQPLEILVFLLPLIAFYEIGLLWVLREGDRVLDNKAHDAIRRVFETIGLDPERMSLPALSLPGLLLVVVLLVWHVLTRRNWTVDLRTVGLMVCESACLALPLVVLAQVVVQALSQPILALSVGAGQPLAYEALRELPIVGRIAVSIGAGLYEELVFRMLAIAVVHTICVDLFKRSERTGILIAIAVSTILFTIYHPLHLADGSIDWPRAAAYIVIGLYFGSVYAYRGFGIVVGAHAAYDIAVLLL